MLSDEENEVLEILKSFEPDDLVECAIYLQALEKITNLIEKQQKEIEEYKKQLDLDYVKNNYTSNDKIKAKIESVDYSSHSKAERIAMKEVLQSLCGKEKENANKNM